MALATRCPQCGAMFRVVADQLKLRGGLVRCGQCRTVFDAIGSLAYVEDGTLPGGRAAEAAAPVAESEVRSVAAPARTSAAPAESAAPAMPAPAAAAEPAPVPPPVAATDTRSNGRAPGDRTRRRAISGGAAARA